MKAARTTPRARLLTAAMLLLLPGALLPACSTQPTPVPTPIESQVQDNDEAVYLAAFAEIYGTPRMYVLAEQTSPGIEGVEQLEYTLELVLARLEGVQEATGEDFRLRNQESLPLRQDMDLGLPYVLLPDEEFDEIFNINTSGWDIFYTRYPNSPGITTLSQVGFNEDLTQALVYVGTQSNWLAGVGYYLLLGKVEDAWQVIQKVTGWIS